jgi:hypothetical protein
MSSPDTNSRVCEIINSSPIISWWVPFCTLRKKQEWLLKYTMENRPVISLHKCFFIILLFMILISTLFYFKSGISVNKFYKYVYDRVKHTRISYSEYNATTLNVAVVPKYATLTWKDKVNSSVSPADPKRLCPVTPPGLGKVQENHWHYILHLNNTS